MPGDRHQPAPPTPGPAAAPAELQPLPPLPFLRARDAVRPSPSLSLARELAVAGAGALAALLFALLVLGLRGDPWFQDDPVVAWLVTHLTPLDILRSGDWGRAIGAGNQLTPLLPISFWFDQWLGGTATPAHFYLHQAVALAVTAAVWCALIHRLSGSAPLALAATFAWLLTGSTITLAEFLAARHYLEGGAFFLLALRLTVWTPATPAARAARLALVLAALSLAMLAKEIYIILGLAALVPFALHWRRFRIAYATFILAFCFLYVRLFIIGPELTYHTLLPAPLEMLPRIVRHAPVRFAGSAGGAALLVLLPVVWLALRRRAPDPWIVLWFVGMLAAGCAVIAPVSAPLAAMFDFPAAWGRILAHLHTIVIGFFVWLTASTILPPGERQGAAPLRARSAPRALAMMAVVVAALLPGALRQRAAWDELKQRYETERHFYLMHPERLVRTELAAHWYLYGIHLLEGVERVHFFAQPNLRELDAEWFQSFDTIWRLVDGEWYRDDARHAWLIPYARYDTIRAIEQDQYRPGHRDALWGRRLLHPLQSAAGGAAADGAASADDAATPRDAAWLGGLAPDQVPDPDEADKAEARRLEAARAALRAGRSR